MGSFLETLVSPISAIFRYAAESMFRRLPHPSGPPMAHAPGPDADRLLLVGSTLVMGYGVLSHDLGFAGFLARRLSERTGRGVTVDIIGDSAYTLDRVPDLIDTVRLGRYDALLLSFNGAESGRPVSPKHWRNDLDRVLTDIARRGFGSLHVFVIGLPFISAIPGPFGAFARRRAVVLNRQSMLVCAEHPTSTFLTVDGGPSGPTVTLTGDTYGAWASLLGGPLAEALTTFATASPPHDASDELRRQATVDAMEPVSDEELADLDSLLTTARHLFGVHGAAITIIDGEKQVVRSASGIELPTIPRSSSICELTITDDGALVVHDVLHDRRIRDRVDRMDFVPRFYAGYPLEAVNGERVGALCLLGDEPRVFSKADASLLRDLALRAQSIMWREGEHPPAST